MWPWTSSYPAQPLESIALPRSTTSKKVYDYVIVGGGTAGCVLASRLSEDPTVSVLLVERGPVVDSWASSVPLLSTDYRVNSSLPAYRWATTPIKTLNQRTLDMISGRALGGTSKINAFFYTRSIPGEYNAWARDGRTGWSYQDLEPYFSRSEKSLTHGDSPHRGAEGLWENQRLDEIYYEHTSHVIKATTALGIPFVKKANDPDQPVTACTKIDKTVDSRSRRHSTFDAFLPVHIALQRKGHLTICAEVIATSLNIKPTPKGIRVLGVYLEHDSEEKQAMYNEPFYVRARREVILCGGAIATPQLLMLSGIGRAEHLRELGVCVLKDLPGVGMHLQDHLGVPVMYRAPLNDTLNAVMQNPYLALKELIKYIFMGNGIFLSPVQQLCVFVRSVLLDDNLKTDIMDPSQVDAHNPENLPDIEIMPFPCLASNSEFDLQGDGAFSLMCVQLRPKSLGTVRLASGTDARVRPACDLGSLAAREDLTILRKAVRLALQIGRQMREQGYPLRDLHVPQSESDDDLDAFIVQSVVTTYHYSSTCRMAPEDAEIPGVVDNELRVHGVRGLRVADASVFPWIPAAHLQAPVVMIAEKCADFLREAKGKLSS